MNKSLDFDIKSEYNYGERGKYVLNLGNWFLKILCEFFFNEEKVSKQTNKKALVI